MCVCRLLVGCCMSLGVITTLTAAEVLPETGPTQAQGDLAIAPQSPSAGTSAPPAAYAGSPTRELAIADVRAFGAAGDGRTLDTAAIARAVEAVAEQGGGTLYFPAGRYLTGPIFLRSHLTLELAAGAVIAGSTNWDDYPLIDSRWEGVERTVYASLIQAIDCENVAIVGRGLVDGQGEAWWQPHKRYADRWRRYEQAGATAAPAGEEDEWRQAQKARFPRPRLVEFLRCHNVFMQGVTLKDSAAWTLHPVYCENVTLSDLVITAPENSRNTDGINPDSCRFVRIANCHIDVGDDCIAIKSGRDEDGRRVGRPCEDIVITNCTMVHGHGGVVIGSEMSGDVRNVVVTNCVFDGTDRGLRMKTTRGRGGVVEGVQMSNVLMRNVRVPINVNMFYQDVPPEPVSARTPRFRDIRVSHILATGAETALELRGLPEMPVEHFSLSHARITAREGAICRAVSGLTFHAVEIESGGQRPLVAEHVTDLDVDGFSGRSDNPEQPVLFLHQVLGAWIRNCALRAPSRTLARIGGGQSRGIVFSNNLLAEATETLVLERDLAQGAVSLR